MKKMLLILGIIAVFFGTNALAQTGIANLDLFCWNGVQLVGTAPLNLDSKVIVTNNTPAIEANYALNIACVSVFASFAPSPSLVQSSSSSVGGTSQAIREHPVFFNFSQSGAGNCTATLNYSGTMKSCSFPYNIGNVQPPVPPINNNLFLIGGVLVVVLLFGAYLLFGYKKGGS